MEKILILGGTGTTGRRIARRLTAAGHRVRTASRKGADVRFDLDQPTSWAPALEGVGAVYVLKPDMAVNSDPRAGVRGFVSAAAAAGVRRVVLLSGNAVGEADDSNPLKAVEQTVRTCGAEWTILRPDWFAQNFSETFWRLAILDGTLALPTGDGHVPFVDAEDIAEVAAAALTDQKHSGRTYHLTGPRALSFGEAVDIIGRASGRQVQHVDIEPEEFIRHQLARGVPEQAARLLAGLLVAVRDGRGVGVADGVEEALGRPARTFEAFAAQAAAAGAWS
ncbi:NAD(P)H-binding protein [Kitasatospora sp. RB6PN24]|uniref:NmrA family NAD(P)-binding protein n=1 Tax=Kitasatospora humi TaxID=2893891 RepID=UPI001E358353|nr:NmrA family NAD(P)-binding protein [Kitasatospora humi]MCC9307844.1 NAD(P)H-binding protein [Kitasatospora humi]